MFKKREKVFYVGNGVGIIEDIQGRISYKGQYYKDIYYIRMIDSNTLIIIPSENAEELGIRKLVKRKDIEEVFSILKSEQGHNKAYWIDRLKEYPPRIESSSIFETSKALAFLHFFRKHFPDIFHERKSLRRAKKIIASEIIAVGNLSEEEAYTLIDKALKGREVHLPLPLEDDKFIKKPLIEIVDITSILIERLKMDFSDIFQISPENFEDLIHDRIIAMGLEAERVGGTYHKDGGIDIVFWPTPPCPIPFLGAAQIKHRQSRKKVIGPEPIREFGGVLVPPFNIGLFITNTTFSPDANWYAKQKKGVLRLRDMNDLKRWIESDFTNEREWREIPDEIEIAPGVIVTIKIKN